MPAPQDNLPLQDLVQPQQPEVQYDPNRVAKYKQFIDANPQLSHVPFEAWDTEARRLEAPAPMDPALAAATARAGGGQFVGGYPNPITPQGFAKAAMGPIQAGFEESGINRVAGEAIAPIGQLVDIATGNAQPAMQSGPYEEYARSFGKTLPETTALLASGVGLPGFMAHAAGGTLAQGGSLTEAGKAAAITGLVGKTAEVGGRMGERYVGQQITNAMRPTGGLEEAQAVNRQLAEKALTGTAPKVGQAVGQVAGATAATVGAQVAEGQDPLSAQSIAQTATNAIMFGAPAAANAMFNKSGYNNDAARMLNRWWLEKQSRQPGQPSLPETAAEHKYVTKLLEESSSIPDNDLPKWRQSVVEQSFRDMQGMAPTERRAAAARTAQIIVEGRDLNEITDSSVQTAMMAYISPPKNVEELANLARRINVLKEDALKLMDERVAAGEEGMSSAAMRQLFGQGFITRKIDHNWMVEKFGEAYDRSLLNSNATAYTVMTQQMANELLILGMEGAKARSTDIRKKSISAEDTSARVAADKAITTKFIEALSKIPNDIEVDPETGVSKLKMELYNRFTHHEETDRMYDTGEGNKFMSEITDHINALTAGKSEAEYGTIDWRNATAPQAKTIRTQDESGAERESQVFKDTSLNDYLAKDFEGKYLKKVYGRSTRSQQEIVMSQMGFKEGRPVGERGPMSPEEAGSRQETYSYDPDQPLMVLGEEAKVAGREAGDRPDPFAERAALEQAKVEGVEAKQPEIQKDWSAQADQLRGYLQNINADDLWKTIATSFMSPGKTTVDPRTVRRFQPIIKEVIQALFEGGLVEGKQAKESPAAEALVQKLGVTIPKGRTAAGTVDRMLRESFKQGGRTLEQVRTEIFQKIAGEAGIDVPPTETAVAQPKQAVFDTPALWHKTLPFNNPFIYAKDKQGQFTKLLTEPPRDVSTIGASGGMGGMADVYVILSQYALANGLDPAAAERIVKMGMTFVNVANAGSETYTRLAPTEYHPHPPGTKPKLENVRLAGVVYQGALTKTYPITALAYDHIDKNPLSSWLLLGVLSHETAHLMGILSSSNPAAFQEYPFNGAYTQEQLKAYSDFYNFGKNLTPERRRLYLDTLYEIALPEQVRTSEEGRHFREALGDYASPDRPTAMPAEEFVSVAMQYITVGLLNENPTKLTTREVFSSLPDEVGLFVKAQYRNVMFNMNVIKRALNSPEFLMTEPGQQFDKIVKGLQPDMFGQVEQMIKMTERMVLSKDLSVARAEANKLYFNLKNINAEGLVSPFVLSTKLLGPNALQLINARIATLSPEEAKQAEDLAMYQRMSAAINETFQLSPEISRAKGERPWPKDEWLTQRELDIGGEMAPPPKGPKVTQQNLPFPETPKVPIQMIRPDVFERTIMLTNQMLDNMSRRGIPVAHDAIHALMGLTPVEKRAMLSMFGPFLTKDGKFDVDSPSVQMRQDTSPQGVKDNKLFTDLAMWMQKNEKFPLEQNANGEWGYTKEASKDGFPGIPTARVVDSLLKSREAAQVAAQFIIDSRVRSASYRVARMIMSIQPEDVKPVDHKMAYDAASNVVRGLMSGNQRMAAIGLQDLLPGTSQAVMSFLNGGVIKELQALQTKLTERGEWFLPESRPGRFFIRGTDADGKVAADGVKNMVEANQLRQEYEAKGYKNIEIVDKSEVAKYADYDSPEGVLNSYVQAEQESWNNYLTSNPDGLPENVLTALRAYAPAVGKGVEQMMQTRGTNKFLIKRQRVPSIKGLDYFEILGDYIPRLASTVSRSETRQKVELMLADSRLRGQEAFANYLRSQLDAALYPSQTWERNAQAFTAGYFMAGNLSSMVVNGMDAVITLPETLVSKGAQGTGFLDANKHVGGGMKFAVWANHAGNEQQIKQTAEVVMRELADAKYGNRPARKFTPDEIRAYAAFNAVQLQQLDSGLMHDVFAQEDFKALSARAFGTGNKPPTVSELVSDPVYRTVRTMLTIPRLTHSMNNWIAFGAGVEQAISQGMGPREAMEHANLIRTLSLYTGGKTNAPGYMGNYFKGSGLSTVRVMHTMAQYTTGILGQYYSHMKESVSNDPHMTPVQRIQARKALGTLATTNLALAGLLGLPLVGALFKIIGETFGTTPESDVRKGLAMLVGADEDNTGFRGTVTELAMNGGANQLFRVNVGPRLGVAEALGFSNYEGFNLLDMAAGTSIVKKMYDGLGYLAQGQPYKAATSLAPNFLRRVSEMAGNRIQYGDYQFRNPQGVPIYDPSVPEMLAFGTGFDPARLSEAKRKDRLISESDKLYTRNRERQINDAAIAQLQGNMKPTYDWVKNELQLDPSKMFTDPMGPARVVADKASSLRQVQDPLATTPLGNSNEARAIAQTFPAGTTERRSELQATIDRIRQEAGVGGIRGDTGNQLSKAVLIDAMVKQGLTKAQAEQRLRMMGY